MKSRHFMVALVVLNLSLLAAQLANGRPDQPDSVVPLLRVRALELVDDRGRVRGELKILPAQPNLKMPDGTTGYPEAVQLRLISSQGAPNVKLGALEDGSGMSLGGDKSYVQVLSRGANPFVKVVNKDGTEKVFKP